MKRHLFMDGLSMSVVSIFKKYQKRFVKMHGFFSIEGEGGGGDR